MASLIPTSKKSENLGEACRQLTNTDHVQSEGFVSSRPRFLFHNPNAPTPNLTSPENTVLHTQYWNTSKEQQERFSGVFGRGKEMNNAEENLVIWKQYQAKKKYEKAWSQKMEHKLKAYNYRFWSQ